VPRPGTAESQAFRDIPSIRSLTKEVQLF
jgi:hypothetical protein